MNWSIVANVILVILLILVVVLAVLYFLGRKMEKRQVEQQSAIDAAKQTVSLMAIDKKKLKPDSRRSFMSRLHGMQSG